MIAQANSGQNLALLLLNIKGGIEKIGKKIPSLQLFDINQKIGH
jgi:hypothetical protein